MYESRTSLGLFSLLLLLGPGCPNDITGPSGDTETGGASTSTGGSGADTTGSSADNTSGVDSTAGSDSTGEPPAPPTASTVNCASEYTALSGLTVFETSAAVNTSELCSDLLSFGPPSEFLEDSFSILVRHPTPWPSEGQRPWVLLQHGNFSQSADEYEHIINPLVERGFVVFAPDVADANRQLREDQVLCSLRWATTVFADASRLGSCFGMIGHSSGGRGVADAARTLATSNDPLASGLAGIVAIAPATPTDYTDIFAEQHPPLLVLVGTHDEDTDLAGSGFYEVIANEGGLDKPSPLAGSQAGRVGEKVFIEAFDVSHNAFGGKSNLLNQPSAVLDESTMNAKGHAIAAAYIPAFFDWQLFGDPTDRVIFTDNEFPAGFGLETAAWWNYLPQWNTVDPLIFTSYQMGDRRGLGMQRLPVATMENNAALPFKYPGVAESISPSGPITVQPGTENLLVMSNGTGLRATDLNEALRVDWSSGPGSLRFENFDLPQGFTPDHLSLRVGNIFDGWSAGAPDCTAVSTEQPLSMDLRLRDSNGAVVSTRFDDIVVQDHMDNDVGGCDETQSLYTLRVPISCMALESGTAFAPNLIDSIDLRFGADSGALEGSVLLDSVELTSSPEEPPVPSCAHLSTPPPPLAPSYLCVDYTPGDYIDFTSNASPPAGASLGTMTVDSILVRHVAGRPDVVSGCDSARYELDTVSVDQDGDGTVDISHDVRSLQSVDTNDLVAHLGLEANDAAITINEPGKPLSNAVELYDYGSFVAAYRRFAALPDLEVRLLREQPGGIHQPVLLDAYVQPDTFGVDPPQPPSSPSTYSLPSGATYVSNSTDLVSALALPTGQDIIVADGDYTWTGPVVVAGPHRVWSENLLGATIQFGLTYAGNADRTGGLELHGLEFLVDNANMAPAGGGSTHILYTWGQGGEDLLVEDCTFDGDLVIGDAIGAFAPNGLVVRRTEISNFWGYGLVAKQGAAGTVLTSEPLLEDLQIRSVFGATPGSSNGAWENGLLLGNNGTIRRADIRDVGWSAIQLYNDATGVIIEDVFIDFAGPGVWGAAYTEARGAGIWLAQSHDVEIDRVRIESHVFLGINVHWDMGNPDPFLNTTPPRNHNITISDLYSRAYKIGVHLDLGVEDAIIRASRFEHAWMAGILDNNRFEDDWGWHPCPGGEEVCLPSPNRTENIDCYLQDEADCVAHHHNGGSTATPPPNWPSHPDNYLQPGGQWNRNDAAYPTEPTGGGSGSGGQVDSSTSG